MSILGNSPHRELTEAIIGGFFETANELGPGYSERVNQRSLQIVLIDRGLDARIDVPIRVFFRGRRVGRFFADLVVNETVLIEVKALATPDEAHGEKQILNYLRCAGGGIGFLVNFGKSVSFKRYAMGDLTNCLPRLRERGSAPVGRWADRPEKTSAIRFSGRLFSWGGLPISRAKARSPARRVAESASIREIRAPNPRVVTDAASHPAAASSIL